MRRVSSASTATDGGQTPAGAAHSFPSLLVALGLALAGGLALFAGHPPLDQGWLGPLALAPLLALARRLADHPRYVRAGLAWGLVAGVAFFGPLLYWIGRFGTVPLVVLVVIQAAFVAVYVAVMSAWGTRPGRAAVAVVGWVALEAVRSSAPFGGMPWGQLGLSQHLGGPLLGVARTFGVLGVTAACALIAVCAEAIVHRAGLAVGGAGRSPRAVGEAGQAVFGAVRVPLIGLLVVFTAAVVIGGDPPPDTDETIDAAAVQGNDQELPPITDRDETARIERIADRMVVATEALAGDPPDVAVWPENSLDGDTRRNPDLRQRVQTATDLLDGAPIVAGAILDTGPDSYQIAMVRYDADANIVDAYAKRRLVPFGEYVPLRPLVGWYPTIQRFLPGDATPGDQPRVFDIADAAIGPITCWESVYPDLVRDQVRAGAEVLVVSANNASFGRTAATEQHLAFSRVRAVETGRWVLHAAISGVSAVVDPSGESSQETELFEQDIVRADLPLVNELTPFMRTGDLVAPASMLLGGAALAWLFVDRIRGRVRQ